MLTLGLDAEAAPPRVPLEEERIRAADAIASPYLKECAAADRTGMALADEVSGDCARSGVEAPAEEGERGCVGRVSSLRLEGALLHKAGCWPLLRQR